MTRLKFIISNCENPFNRHLAEHLGRSADRVGIEDCASGFDVLILGDHEPAEDGTQLIDLADKITRQLSEDFQLVRDALRHGRRGSRIFFLVQPHQLAYDGIPSRPVFTAARLAMMRSLAKEAMVFGISVNALSCFYGMDEKDCRRLRKDLRLYGPRLPLMSREELFEAIERLVTDPLAIGTGEDISLCSGLPHNL